VRRGALLAASCRVRLALLAVVLTGCIIPFATPPVKGEIGGGTRVGREDERNAKALHAAAGTHLASGTTSEAQPFDVGAGWTMEKTADTISHGIYLDAAVFIDRTRRTRTSIGARGEVRWLDEGKAAAAKLRIDTELFGSGSRDFESDGHCGSTMGTHYGTTAIGLFVEAGHVWAPAGDPMSTTGGNAWVATAGLTVRLPSAVGVWVGVPGC
jgi:hypothetical protein